MIFRPIFLLVLIACNVLATAQKKHVPQPFVPLSTDTINLEDGLRCIMVQENKEGFIPQKGDKIVLCYHVYFSDGRLFFSTGPKENAITIRLGKGEVVKGLEIGLKKLRSGEKARLIVPQTLAYGGDPNLHWIYDVEVLSVKSNEILKPFDVKGKDTVSTSSGLKYIIAHKGNGRKAITGYRAVVHYTGYFLNEKIFDSSVERGETFDFVVGSHKVIAGWEEVILLMNVGDKVRLILPPDLAYGKDGNLMIPPNSTLVFDMELIAVLEK